MHSFAYFSVNCRHTDLFIFYLSWYTFVFRRSASPQLYTSNQVHLLLGYPSSASGSLQVAFYVQQPVGLSIGNVSVLPQSTLLGIFIEHKSELAIAIGANISDVKVLPKPSTIPTTMGTTAPTESSSSDDWKWIVIGVSIGVVVIIVIVVIVVYW